MIISHRCKFIVFSDPLESCLWLYQALSPWADQLVSPTGRPNRKTPFFQGMTPAEAQTAFARLGLDFDSYMRIALVQNPFRRMAVLYDRICERDFLWRLRARLGWQAPDFRSWLLSGQFARKAKGIRRAARWQRFGGLRADIWAGGLINHFVRAEFAATDLRDAMRHLGVVPALDLTKRQTPHQFGEMLRYDRETFALIRQRYEADLQFYSGLGSSLELVA